MVDLIPLLLPIGIGVIYAVWPAHPSRTQRAVFTAGLATLAFAVGPPIDLFADRSLTAHMTQHVLLLTVVPPLLVAGAPIELRSSWRAALTATAVQTVVMWCWHVPALYDSASGDSPVHGVEHLIFLAVGIAFWTTAMSTRIGIAAPLVLFLAALPGTGLGVALTLAAAPWYHGYRDLESQQVAGVVMWAGAGTVYLIAAAVLAVRAVRDDELTGALT